MTVCKFFQQGYCRYGQNCRFEHIYASKYSYHANPQANVPSQQPPAPTVLTDEQLVNQVQSDIQAALKGGQWILSSYAPFKEKPAYPGLSDLSPEEARLFIYEAKAKNTVDQAVFYMNNLFKETRSKYEQLLQPTLNTIKVLRSLYRGETVSQPSFQTNNNASSIFRSAVNIPSTNQNNSIFNQNNNQNIFAQKTDNTAAKSIFSQANNAFGQNNTATIFQLQNDNNKNTPNIFQTQAEPKSIFATENQKIFGVNQTQTPTNPANIFANATQNIFGKSEPVQTFSQNIFQKPPTASNIFQQNTSENENGIYSKYEDLSQDDIKAYESAEFKLGFVPELPPPQSLCS